MRLDQYHRFQTFWNYNLVSSALVSQYVDPINCLIPCILVYLPLPWSNKTSFPTIFLEYSLSCRIFLLTIFGHTGLDPLKSWLCRTCNTIPLLMNRYPALTADSISTVLVTRSSRLVPWWSSCPDRYGCAQHCVRRVSRGTGPWQRGKECSPVGRAEVAAQHTLANISTNLDTPRSSDPEPSAKTPHKYA